MLQESVTPSRDPWKAVQRSDINKSKAVDWRFHVPLGDGANPGWNSSLSAGKKAQEARSSRDLGTATGLTHDWHSGAGGVKRRKRHSMTVRLLMGQSQSGNLKGNSLWHLQYYMEVAVCVF